MTVTLAPTPVLVCLQMAAELCDPAAVRLVGVMADGFPGSLQRRTAHVLAEADATPVDLQRLLRASGFTDLNDVRWQVSKQTGRRVASQDLLFTNRSGQPGERSALKSVLRHEQANLAQTLGALEVSGALELAAAAILASRRRWVLGDMKSTGYAALFTSDLSTALRDVNLISPNAAAAVTALADAHSSDTLTAFSFHNYSRFTLGVASEFRAMGATVIAVTDDYASPICRLADHVLAVNTGSESATHSPTAVAAVGHVLASLSSAGAKGATRRSRRHHELAEALNCYPRAERGHRPLAEPPAATVQVRRPAREGS